MKSRKSKQLRWEVQRDESPETEDESEAFVLNVLNRTECPEHPQSRSSTPSVINEPTTLTQDLTLFMFVGITTRLS
jgi:hypothetical protein